MFTKVELVLTTTSKAKQYFEGIHERDNLYDTNAANIPVHLLNPERHTTTRRNDTEGLSFELFDTEGSGTESGIGSPVRQRRRRFRFTLPRRPPSGGDSREGVGGHPEERWDSKFTEVLDTVRDLREYV